ncbi:carboxylate-amine ligase [Microlunatus ginsengisoli]|uniref:Putative glutamate--cysteine ligase 2 n=1 Tax=Microlunatus ginsengisoli TaxID=363863 RepID=A0ABP7AJF1_9ACTN
MRTVGVEEELLLVDAEDHRPRAVAGLILSDGDEDAGGTESGGVEAELQQQQIEIGTPATTDLGTLRRQLVEFRARADALALERGARIAPIATCPVPVVPRTTIKPRYQRMAEHLGLTTAEQLTCGCHVHVDVSSPDEGVAILDRIRSRLPILVALSANSPFWQGTDSGYASFRTQAWHRFPTAGPTPVLGSAAAYRRYVDALLRTDVPMDEGMIYFDARLSRNYPTVEVRVADVCLRVDDTVLIAALVRALADTAGEDWRAGRPAPEVSSDLIRLATWRASRFGLDDTLLDPLGGEPRPAWEVVDGLVAELQEALVAAGDADRVREGLQRIRAEGTGAEVQRGLAGAGDRPTFERMLREVVRLGLTE